MIDHFFPKMKLISFETSLHTHERQEFHRFDRKLVLNREDLSGFASSADIGESKSIFWLDYTGLDYSHFGDFQKILQKVAVGSIVRITLRAQPQIDLEALKKSGVSEEELKRIKENVEKSFYDEFADVLPHEQVDAFATSKSYARMVQLMIRRAASKVFDVAGKKKDFLPIQSTYYDDNTQMLSVTGVIYLRDDKSRLMEKLREVRFADFEWNHPTQLNIPALSLKERLCLEKHLPVADETRAGEVLYEALGYNIESTAAASKKRLAEYAIYYRNYPHFVRMWD